MLSQSKQLLLKSRDVKRYKRGKAAQMENCGEIWSMKTSLASGIGARDVLHRR